jgi:lysophospholipase L1-like esterase
MYIETNLGGEFILFKRKLKLIPLILIMSVTIALLPAGKASAAKPGTGGTPTTPTTSTINYVALGDSIATGTVLNDSKITSYVTYFGQYLKSYYGKKATVNVQNLAHDGDASNELLALLTLKTGTLTTSQGYHRDITSAESAAVQAAVKNANVITISIGGNNLMRAANIPGFTTIDTDKAQKGVDDFLAQWPLILQAIKDTGTNAKVIVNTVYNPYNTRNTWLYPNDLELHKQVDTYLSQINAAITSSEGIKVADVHSTFHTYADAGKMGDVTYFYPAFFSIARNPHPTSTGQNIIKDLVIKAYNQQ